MKKLALLFVAILVSLTLCFSENEYTNKWPVINDNKVNARDYPDTSKGSVIFQLSAGQKVSIRYKTTEKSSINGYSDYWYYIDIQSGDNENGRCWVFGKYITFQKGYDELFWNNSIFPIKRIDPRVAYKKIVINKVLDDLYDQPNNGFYSLNLLKPYKLKEVRKTSLWYMQESGYTDANTYSTSVGETTAFVNTIENKWIHVTTKINHNYNKFCIKNGMSISELESIFGTEYSIKDNILSYSFNEDFDMYYLSCELSNSNIQSFIIESYFD